MSAEQHLDHTLTYQGGDWILSRPDRDRVDPTTSVALLSAVPDLWVERFGPPDPFALGAVQGFLTGTFADTLTGLAWLAATTPSQSSRWLTIRGELSSPDQFHGTDAGAIASGIATPCTDLGAALTAAAWLSVAMPDQSPRWMLFRAGRAMAGRSLAVTGADGATVTLLIGAKSPRTGSRRVPQTLPNGETRDFPVPEEYRYARLAGNDQVFEIRAERLGDVFVSLETLRDAKLARFKREDIRRLEIDHQGQEIVFLRGQDRWRLVRPIQAEADRAKVEELIDRLSQLEARGPDVIYGGQVGKYGLDKPDTTVRMQVLEEVPDEKAEGATREIGAEDAAALVGTLGAPAGQGPLLSASVLAPGKARKLRTLVWQLGNHDEAAKKLYVRTDDWPRINVIEDSLAPLVKRPALAYRGKRLFDFTPLDVTKIDVEKGEQKLTLTRERDGWRLIVPAQGAQQVAANADGLAADSLATTLSQLQATEFINDNPTEAQLAEYGLDKPALTATVALRESSQGPQVLRLGKERSTGAGYFAQVQGSPSVFVVIPEVHAALGRDALAYLPVRLWDVPPTDVTALVIEREGQPAWKVIRKDGDWKIGGPFEAPALDRLSEQLAMELSAPMAEGYKALEAKDPASYGFDKPYLTLTLTGKDGAVHKLQVGKPTAPESGSRFARLLDDPKNPAVFTMPAAALRSAERGPLDLLDPVLLRVQPPDQVDRIQSKTATSTLTLEHKDREWRVLDTPASPFNADAEVVVGLRRLFAPLRAQRFVAYGPEAEKELAKYGLDKPEVTLTVRIRKAEGMPETEEHLIELSKPSAEADGSRHVRVDKKPGIAVLPAAVAGQLAAGYLDFVDRTVLKLDPASVTSLVRQLSTAPLEIVRRDEGWQILKPGDEKADDATMQNLVAQLAALRADRVVAYPAGDLKTYELDRPRAVIRIKTGDGKPTEHVLAVGKSADEAGACYAMLEGSKTVVVLPAALAKRLTAEPVAFRERTLAKLRDVDRADLERGRRKATFAKVEGTWKLTAPVAGEASQDELDDFVNLLARLRADELVKEKPTALELQGFGLDKPEARWKLSLNDRVVMELLAGNREKNGPRVYARLADQDLVFLLDPKLTERVLGEYRPRTVWSPSLDASQIDSIRFGFAKAPFTLEKAGNAWVVADMPDAPLPNPALVNETLGALAGLKLVRYVQDKDADPKLYGLEKPELTLEATTRTGKRTLQIGAVEGDSKRRYARVVEPGRSDVFTIGEADLPLLLRDLKALSQPSAPRPMLGE
jgi:hypothetical protein